MFIDIQVKSDSNESSFSSLIGAMCDSVIGTITKKSDQHNQYTKNKRFPMDGLNYNTVMDQFLVSQIDNRVGKILELTKMED